MPHFGERSGEGGWGAAGADPAPPGDDGDAASPGGGRDGGPFAVEHLTGPAAVLHGLMVGERPGRLVRWLTVERPALVLGSTQPDSVAAGHVEAVRRRSGGSAVLVRPGSPVWLDVVLPAGDPLWDDDVGLAPLWLGRCWARALAALGVPDLAVHAGAMVRSPWSDLICFAGLAPGEVTAGGRKIVGVSQRRTRAAVLFQVAVLVRWDPRDIVAALAGPHPPVADLRAAAVGVEDILDRPVSAEEVEGPFLDALGAATTGR